MDLTRIKIKFRFTYIFQMYKKQDEQWATILFRCTLACWLCFVVYDFIRIYNVITSKMDVFSHKQRWCALSICVHVLNFFGISLYSGSGTFVKCAVFLAFVLVATSRKADTCTHCYLKLEKTRFCRCTRATSYYACSGFTFCCLIQFSVEIFISKCIFAFVK